MRMHSVSSTIENGFVHVPVQASWLAGYLHEMATFPNGKYDDQVDSTSQVLDWSKNGAPVYGVLEYYRSEAAKLGLTWPLDSPQNQAALYRLKFNRATILRERYPQNYRFRR
jgi:hypothetical protein